MHRYTNTGKVTNTQSTRIDTQIQGKLQILRNAKLIDGWMDGWMDV